MSSNYKVKYRSMLQENTMRFFSGMSMLKMHPCTYKIRIVRFRKDKAAVRISDYSGTGGKPLKNPSLKRDAQPSFGKLQTSFSDGSINLNETADCYPMMTAPAASIAG